MERIQSDAGNACEKAEKNNLMKLTKRLKYGECLGREESVKRVKKKKIRDK